MLIMLEPKAQKPTKSIFTPSPILKHALFVRIKSKLRELPASM